MKQYKMQEDPPEEGSGDDETQPSDSTGNK